MTKTAEQMDRDRYFQGGLRDGRNAEQARCEGILRRAMTSGGTLLTALAAIEAGNDDEPTVASVAPRAQPARATVGGAKPDLGDIVAAHLEQQRGKVY